MNNLHQSQRCQQVMKVSQLLKPNVVDTTAFNSLSPRHKEVVTNFYNEVENSTGDIVNRVEKAIDKIATSNNVSTDVMYDYINKETGV